MNAESLPRVPTIVLLSRQRLWWIFVVLLTITLIAQDLFAITAGLAVLAARELPPSRYQFIRTDLLEFAGRIASEPSAIENQQGVLLYYDGQIETGMKAFQRALAADPQNSYARNNLAVASNAMQQRGEAVALLQQAVEAAPDSATVRYNLGLLLLANEEWLAAERSLREATRIAPDWAMAQAQLAFAQVQQQHDDAAIAAARKALDLANNNQLAYYTLLTAFDRQQKGTELLNTATAAHQLFPEDPTITLYYAMALRHMGQEEDALQLLQTLFFSSHDRRILHRVSQEILGIIKSR